MTPTFLDNVNKFIIFVIQISFISPERNRYQSIRRVLTLRVPRQHANAGYTPKASAPNGTGGNFKGYVPVEIAESESGSVKGPWTLKATIGNGDFNPSPFVFPNGTTVMMWRHLARVHLVGPTATFQGPFLFNGSDSACPPPPPPPTLTASEITSVERPGCSGWHLFSEEVDNRGVEDPFIFVQPTADTIAGDGRLAAVGHNGSGGDGTSRPLFTYHALFHDHKSFGGHAFSLDGIAWTYSSVIPFGNVVNFTDATSVVM